ncbi:hypothetical protein EON79_20300 [bacterium]|nr:MAG: hypothetical protein EON79_20300 [bacterium]
MRKTLSLLMIVASLGAFAGSGCSSSTAPEAGYTKEDFAKRPPPPGYGPAGAAPAANAPAGTTTGN